MANELAWRDASTGLTVYAVISRDADLYHWNGASFEAYTVANWSTYAVALTETPSSGRLYVASLPAIAAGLYTVRFFQQEGPTPSLADTILGEGQLIWNGTAEVTQSGDAFASLAAGVLLSGAGETQLGQIVGTLIAGLATSAGVSAMLENLDTPVSGIPSKVFDELILGHDIGGSFGASLSTLFSRVDTNLAAAIATVIAAAAGLQARRASPSYTALGGTVVNLSIAEDSAGDVVFTCYGPTGELADLTGVHMQFVFVDHEGTKHVLGNGEGETGLSVGTPASGGVVTVSLSSVETATSGHGRYELWDASNLYLYAKGTLTVKATEGLDE